MRVPTATYRLQLHARFGLAEVRKLVPYLHDLGISHVYLSPIFQARAGSTHGYDVTDPTRVNPEIGTLEELQALAAELRAENMSILLDIVPNHMAADVQNPWWRDVLEHGPASPYARFFDIDWGAAGGRLLLPVLGRHYGDAIEAGELHLSLGPDGLALTYFDKRLPLDPGTWPDVLDGSGDEAPDALRDLVRRLRSLPARDEARGDVADRRYFEARAITEELWALHEGDPAIRAAVANALTAYDVIRDHEAAGRLDTLVARQAYLPSFWRTASQELNYRRFFDITDLAGVRVEEPEVFDATHRLILEWLRDGTIGGARVDHVDGLFDPTAYLQRLAREGTSDGPPYILVEKILGQKERLPAEWPVAGTTGYELLNLINGLFIEPAGLQAVEEAYRRFSGERRRFGELVYDAKKLVMKVLFGGEVRTLVGALVSLARQDLHGRDLPAASLGRALTEVTAWLPVYRTYARTGEGGCPIIREEDEQILRRTFAEARRSNDDMDPAVFDFLERVLLLSPRDERAAGRVAFLMRWQQLTGPVMAKGLEDTALYRWPALLSACEVGAWPPASAVDPEAFHARMADYAASLPLTMSTLSTHDTKRSGDARARLNVLTELADEWAQTLARWTESNRGRRAELPEGPGPSAIGEVSVYEMMLAAWTDAEREAGELPQRVKDAVLKSSRESKLRTSWHHPSEAYEQATMAFVDALFADDRFMADFRAFEQSIATAGMVNGLAQALVQLTIPGVPDIYQGTETWRLSLVDPDNRRPVHFQERVRLLEQVQAADPADAARWLAEWRDGRIKLHVVAAALRQRREHAELFAQGEYLPLRSDGARAGSVLGFARRRGADWSITAVPRLAARLAGVDGRPPVGSTWADTVLRLPSGAPPAWRDVLTGAQLSAKGDTLALADLFRTLPVVLLTPAWS